MEDEKTTEKYLTGQMKLIRGSSFKWSSPQMRGVPDRICIFPTGRIIFVELKSEGDKPTSLQIRCHNLLRNLNCKVYVVDTKAKVDRLIRRYYGAQEEFV